MAQDKFTGFPQHSVVEIHRRVGIALQHGVAPVLQVREHDSKLFVRVVVGEDHPAFSELSALEDVDDTFLCPPFCKPPFPG